MRGAATLVAVLVASAAVPAPAGTAGPLLRCLAASAGSGAVLPGEACIGIIADPCMAVLPEADMAGRIACLEAEADGWQEIGAGHSWSVLAAVSAGREARGLDNASLGDALGRSGQTRIDWETADCALASRIGGAAAALEDARCRLRHRAIDVIGFQADGWRLCSRAGGTPE